MDVDAIRSRFIRDNLQVAMKERDSERAKRALHAFRVYFEWFEDQVPKRDRPIIAAQLAALESSGASARR